MTDADDVGPIVPDTDVPMTFVEMAAALHQIARPAPPEMHEHLVAEWRVLRGIIAAMRDEAAKAGVPADFAWDWDKDSARRLVRAVVEAARAGMVYERCE